MFAGLFDFDIPGMLDSVQAWALGKIDWLLDPMWVWYGWGALAVAACLLIGFFLPFRWARAALLTILVVVWSYILGGRHMRQLSQAERDKLKAQLKAEKAKKKETGWKW